MKLNNLPTFARAAALSVATLTACGPSQEDCDRVFKDSRPIAGTCLSDEWDDLDALREHCGNKIEKAWDYYPYTYTTAQGWQCLEQ